MELLEPLKLDDYANHEDYIKQNYLERDLAEVDLEFMKRKLKGGLVRIIKREFGRYRILKYDLRRDNSTKVKIYEGTPALVSSLYKYVNYLREDLHAFMN